MFKKVLARILPPIFCMALSGCAESRRDPCELLTVFEVESVDSTIEYSVWAGKDEGKKENEVCIYYTANGDPRVMLFVWYDRNADPDLLIDDRDAQGNLETVLLPGVGTRAVAAFSEQELKLLAVRSAEGVVGFRVRKPVTRDSVELLEIAQLAEKALSRN